MTISHSKAEVAMPDSHQKSSLCQLYLGREESFTLRVKYVQFPA